MCPVSCLMFWRPLLLCFDGLGRKGRPCDVERRTSPLTRASESWTSCSYTLSLYLFSFSEPHLAMTFGAFQES